MRTEQEKKEVIAKLKEMMQDGTIREYTAFGDNNWKGVNAQIAVIENDWSNDKIYDKYEYASQSLLNEEDAGKEERTLELALDARQWLDGDTTTEDILGW